MLGLDAEILQDSYNSWGPSARDCLRFAKSPKVIGLHEQDVFRAASELTKDASHFTAFQLPSATHRVFVVRPSPDSREIASVEFGTNRLCDIFARAYARQGHAGRCSFYKTIREHPCFAPLAGQMFEIHLLLWLERCTDGTTLLCDDGVESSPVLKIQSCKGNQKFFYKAEELKDISEPGKSICLVPTSRTFSTLDAVILTSDAVITVQITIALKEDVIEQEFDLIYRNLPSDLLAKRPDRYHVFITDNWVNAESLQEQDHTQIPNGTLVYSTAISAESLDSKSPATEGRVDSLVKSRVSMY